MHRTGVVAILLLILGCSSGAVGVGDPNLPAAVGKIQLLTISPHPGEKLMTDSVLVAELTYSIQHYRPEVEYYIAPLFASNEGPDRTFNELDRITDGTRIRSAEGKATIRYPVARELRSLLLAHPVKVSFYLMELTGPQSSRVIGRTERIEYLTGE